MQLASAYRLVIGMEVNQEAASTCYVMVCLVVANLEQMFFTYRMEFGAELKVELMDRPQALLMRLRP
jgi:hypothetical protein